jgi:hypothetical protein
MHSSQQPSRKHPATIIIIIFVSLGFLFITQYIFNFAYWFDLDLTFLGFLNPLACIWPNFCNELRFPPYGLIALLTAVLAAILFGGLLVWQKIPDFLTEPNFLPIQIPNRVRLNYQVDVPLFIFFGSCQTYVIIQSIRDQPVFPPIWLVGLVTLLLIGWRLDQSQEETTLYQLLSPIFLNGLYVGGIALLLLTTAALHTQRWSWFFVFGTATALSWSRVLLSKWKGWDIPSRLEHLILPLITMGSFLLFSNKLNSWAWSFWGDEYSFYSMGKLFVDGTLPRPILSGAGVYEIHPILSSVWQGTTMWLFGTDGYGWRVSNSLLLAISIPFLYYFLRPILGRTGGFFAVTLYGSAHVLITLGHYGANNVQIIFAMATTLAIFLWAGRRGSWGGFMLAGICLGLGFYMFAVARIYSLILAIWLTIYYFPIIFQDRRIIWENAGVWLAVAGATLLTALPVLSTRSAWVELARQTVLTSEVAVTPYDQFTQFLQNTLYGLTSFLFNNQNSHWVYGAHADPITSTLMVIGLTTILLPNKQTWRVRSSLLASYILFVVIIAGTQQYSYPSITRIFSFVPFYAIFATIGFLAIFYSFMTNQVRNLTGWLPNTVLIGSTIVIASIAVPLNFWQSTVLSQQHSIQPHPAFLLQTAQMSTDEAGGGPHIFYVGSPQHENWLAFMYSVYNIPPDRFTFILSQDALLSGNLICQSAEQPAIVMITTEIPDAMDIAIKLRRCWHGSELKLIKDMLNNAQQYRLINKSALPFIHSVNGYWVGAVIP